MHIGLVTYTVKVNGSSITDALAVKSIEVISGVNKIPSAVITIQDGDVNTGKFTASSSGDFVPGNEITIEAGYDSKNEIIFEGIITKQSLRVNEGIGSFLEVVCRDKSIKMIVGRKSAIFENKKDSEIIKSIVDTYSLKSHITSTLTKWPEQVQYYTSDWDFIMSRAETNGMIVVPLNGEVSVFPPNKNTKPVLNIEYGINLLAFNADLNSVNQYGNVKASSWDYKTQNVVDAKAASSLKGPGNLTTKKLSEVVGLKTYELQTTTPIQKTDLTNWSKAELVKSEYAKIRGEVSFQGSNLVSPGRYITLTGLGDRFNGDHLVSNVTHTIADGNWRTEVTIGLSSVWFTEEPDVIAPPASGLIPGVQGLYNGTVQKIYEDPDNQYRILVNVPLFQEKSNGLWARLSNFYSTSGAGAFFLPEVGDEVVVGFLNQDPRFPIILGSMYSNSKHKPYKELTPNKENSKKAIVSKRGIYIEFDDENKVFTINTPSKNQAIFDDKNKEIKINDQNGNSILMSSSGIELKSRKNITIQASQKLTLKGNTGVNIEATSGDVNVKGLNVKNSASVNFSAQGSASAELKGGAQTSIKGAMVMIN